MKKFIALSAISLTMVGCGAQKKDLTAVQVMENVKTYYTAPVQEALDVSATMPDKFEIAMGMGVSMGTEAGIPGVSSADIQMDLIERFDTVNAVIGYDVSVDGNAKMEMPNMETGEMGTQEMLVNLAAEARIGNDDALFQIRNLKLVSPLLPAEITFNESVQSSWYGESIENIDTMIAGLPEMEGISLKDLLPTDIKAQNKAIIDASKKFMADMSVWEKAELVETEEAFYVLDVETSGIRAIKTVEEYITLMNEVFPANEASFAPVLEMLEGIKPQAESIQIAGKLHVDPKDFSIIGFDGNLSVLNEGSVVPMAKVFFENKKDNTEFSIKINDETAFAYLKKGKEFSVESEGETIVKGEISLLGLSMDFYSMGEKMAHLDLQKDSAKLSFEDPEMPTIVIDEMSADDLFSYSDIQMVLKGRILKMEESAETELANFYLNVAGNDNVDFDLSKPAEVKPVSEFMEALATIQASIMGGAMNAIPLDESALTEEEKVELEAVISEMEKIDTEVESPAVTEPTSVDTESVETEVVETEEK